MTQAEHSKIVRANVMAAVTDIYRDATRRGVDAWRAVEAACPGVPSSVIAEAMMVVDGEEADAWWHSIEKTIDGEIVRHALAFPGEVESGA